MNTLPELRTTSRELRSKVAAWQGQAELLQSEIEEAHQEIDILNNRVDDHKEAIVILQELEKTWRGSFEEALASLGGQGLSAVFAKEMEVVLESSIKRGVASLDLALITEGLRTRIKGAKGGSVAQVLAVLLRILLTISSRPPLRPLLILDEPFSQVSAEFRPALCEMLRNIIERLDAQYIFTSHEDELTDAADTVYQIKADGKGTAVQLKSREEIRE